MLLWRQHSEGGEDTEVADPGRGKRFFPVAGMAFAVVFVAEFGDLTQILTVSLAARYGDPLAVGIGRRWRCGSPRARPSSAAGAC